MGLSRRRWLALGSGSLFATAGGATGFWWLQSKREIHLHFHAPAESMLGTFRFTNNLEVADPQQEGKSLPAFEEWYGKLSPDMFTKLRNIMVNSEKYVPQPLPPPFNKMLVTFVQPDFKAYFEVFIGDERMITLRFDWHRYRCSAEQAEDEERRLVDIEPMDELYDECMKSTRKVTFIYRSGEWEIL